MKKSGFLLFILFILIGLVACGGGGPGDSSGDESRYTELSLDTQSRGSIATVGEVDWYHFRAVETNNVLQLRCSGETAAPTVEFLVTVYEKDADGNLVRLWADHAPEDAALAANLLLNIPISQPKDLYIAVRDLMDDEAAPQTRYRLQLAYINPATDNATFALATDLGTVDAAGVCHTDAIEVVADVDCFSFTVAADGVYNVRAAFNDTQMSTPVRLEMKLYAVDGTCVYPAAGESVLTTDFTLFLEAGQHYIAVQDRGKDHADAFAQYAVCIQPKAADEIQLNDNDLTAQAMTQDLSAPHPKYDVQGTLAYQQDQDWYLVPVAAPGGTEFQTIKLTFNDTIPQGNDFPFELLLSDAGGNQIMAHKYPAGANGYTVQVRVAAGDHLITVRPASDATVAADLHYSLSAEVISVEDAAESIGDGNDGIDEADVLTPPGDSVQGKISFRGDNDWYKVVVPNTADPQVLGIAFQAQGLSNVEYCVEIMQGGSRWPLSDTRNLDAPTQLKTSFYVDVGDEPTFFIKVCDCQADDGEDVDYDLTITTAAAPASVSDVPASVNPEGKATVYNSEIYERSLASGDFDTGQAVDVTCAIYPQYAPVFKANNLLLQVPDLDEYNQYISDWIAGYVDYRGDQDWFVLDIKPMIPYGGSAVPAQWYYDIEIRLYSPGSEVEYTWKLYRDVAHGASPPNQVVVERTPGTTDLDHVDDRDGIMAGWSGPLVTALPAPVVDKTTPEAGETAFWIGDRWGSDRYYLSISDFNYTYTAPSQPNAVPDDDWGYAAPYYFQVRLTYHPDVSNP